MRKWGWRYYKTNKDRHLELILAGRPARIMFSRAFDKRGDGSRLVMLASIDTKRYHYGIMLQHYREGFTFDNHTDGVAENKAVTIILRKPKLGGEFWVNGPLRSFLKGRILAFDGGRYKHGVTKIEQGSRTILMFQRGRWRLT